MAAEHWSRIARLLQEKKDVTLELNVTNTFYDDDPMQYDTIAEIPGTDKKDEVVMLGAHLDSWHARHRGHRQRRGHHRDDGSRPHFESLEH